MRTFEKGFVKGVFEARGKQALGCPKSHNMHRKLGTVHIILCMRLRIKVKR